ncbi:DUF2924 domain-containing protein [Brevundimonas sp. Root608]|nr:DUF2924 domain-containing protein [Brevundimonas sp. Root608]
MQLLAGQVERSGQIDGAGGFLYAGQRWKSLSEIARQITGSRWNGPRFFGLGKEAVR